MKKYIPFLIPVFLFFACSPSNNPLGGGGGGSPFAPTLIGSWSIPGQANPTVIVLITNFSCIMKINGTNYRKGTWTADSTMLTYGFNQDWSLITTNWVASSSNTKLTENYMLYDYYTLYVDGYQRTAGNSGFPGVWKHASTNWRNGSAIFTVFATMSNDSTYFSGQTYGTITFSIPSLPYTLNGNQVIVSGVNQTNYFYELDSSHCLFASPWTNKLENLAWKRQ